MPSAVASRRENRISHQSRRRILVVDDSEDAADLLAMLLRLLGHDVRAVYRGRDALNLLPAFRPSVVLLNLQMPVMTGYETAKRIRANPSCDDVTLIAVSGWCRDEDRKASAEAGFDFHLPKPLDVKELDAILATLKS
jgi:CheY-like chemotaxis protein